MISKKITLHNIIHYLLIIICIMGVLLFVSEIVSALIDTESYHLDMRCSGGIRVSVCISLGVYYQFYIYYLLFLCHS